MSAVERAQYEQSYETVTYPNGSTDYVFRLSHRPFGDPTTSQWSPLRGQVPAPARERSSMYTELTSDTVIPGVGVEQESWESQRARALALLRDTAPVAQAQPQP